MTKRTKLLSRIKMTMMKKLFSILMISVRPCEMWSSLRAPFPMLTLHLNNTCLLLR